MKHLTTLLIAAVVAAVTAFLVAPGTADASRSPSNELDGSLELAALDARLDSLAAENAELRERIASVGLADPAAGSQRESALDVEAVLERLLTERGWVAAGEPAPVVLDESVASARPGELSASSDPRQIFALLTSGDLSGLEREEYWQEIREAGLLDQILPLYELAAERDPNNPDVQVDLGSAYLQKIFEVGEGPLAGKWATKADTVFDRALALDETHWDARFNKAAALSFWPPIFGKQSEAIHNFEVLIEQQGSSQPNAKHAETYLFLGNLHMQNGDREAALSAWRDGASRYPENAGLLEQLQLVDQ